MSNFELSQSSKAILKTFSAVLLAGTVAGCSSDLSRFSYNQALTGDGLTTASVKTPHSGSLAPIGVGTQAFPGDYRQPGQSTPAPLQSASVAPSQLYPGDRQISQPNSTPLYTASIPTTQNLAPTPLAQSRQIVQQTVLRQPIVNTPIVQQQLPAPKNVPFTERVRNALAPKPKPTLQNTVQQAAVTKMPIIRPLVQPSVQQSIVTGSVAQSTGAQLASTQVIVPMAPDPMVTGSVPNKATVSRGGWTTDNGSRVVLSEGETVYNLSRRYGVPAAEILNANGIRDSRTLKVGQSLIIPTYVYSSAATVSAPDNDLLTKSAYSHKGSRTLFPRGSDTPIPSPRNDFAMLPKANAVQNTKVVTVPAKTPTQSANNTISSDQYTVVAGDTLNRIAHKTGVTVVALKSANGLTKSNIRIGQKLAIPSKTFKVMSPDPTTTASIRAVKNPAVNNAKTDNITQKAKVDANVTAPAKTGIDKLRWPAKGQIASSFGGKTDDGKRNDGLDILLPEGSAIKAAENGVVIYASNGLKGYGNTVLVRHDGDIVTVYAHAKQLNVKRGDKVQRGQVIAQSGMTGSAKRPKLHFEVRKSATPQNPIKFLE